eukprot:m.102233 g.102233  ORF g.102233 m.102233 type:complete len:431 (-) comp8995_c0_seq1:70-1362(-)
MLFSCGASALALGVGYVLEERWERNRASRGADWLQEGVDALLGDGRVRIIELSCKRTGLRFSALHMQRRGLAEAQSVPLVLMIHGFPDTPLSFYKNMAAIADAGFDVVCPVLRGYEASSRRDDGSDVYFAESLAGDVADWLDALGVSRAHVIGHDWGAVIASAAAKRFPDRIASLTVMAVPHNVLRGMLALPRQLRLSWYMFFFQLPVLPVVYLRYLGGIASLRNAWSPSMNPAAAQRATWSSAGTDDAYAESVSRALAEPGATLAALGYYRQSVGSGVVVPLLAPLACASVVMPTFGIFGAAVAGATALAVLFFQPLHASFLSRFPLAGLVSPAAAAHRRLGLLESLELQMPVLGIAGAQDGCMDPELFNCAMHRHRQLFPAGLALQTIPRAGHFMHIEAPADVNRLLVRWLTTPNLLLRRQEQSTPLS